MILHLPVPSPLSGGNSRGHWSQVSKAREADAGNAKYAAIEEGWGHLMLSPVNIYIDWYGWNRADPDNIISRCKPIIDGLVWARVIPDDGPDHVKSIQVRTVWYDRTNPHIEIEIERIEE